MVMIQQTESSPFSLCTAERMNLAHTQNYNHKFQTNEFQQRNKNEIRVGEHCQKCGIGCLNGL